MKASSKMKWILITLTLLVAMTGCSDTVNAERYLGNWTQVNTKGIPPMTATISKLGDEYRVDIKLSIPNQAPVVVTKVARFEKGTLNADGIEKIHFNKGSDHLMIGANEFESTK